MGKKKIAFIIGSLSSGGAERVISNLSNELIENFEIVIITFVNSIPFYRLDDRIKVIPCCKVINYSTSIYQSLKLNIILIKKIYQIFKKEQINIAIGFITSANIIAIISAKFYGIPCIISERNNPLRGDLPRFWIILRKFVYPLADKVVLQTEGVKEIYHKKLKPNKIIILPNPISSELTKLRNNTTLKTKLIITVGRLDNNKSQDDIVKAFMSINPQDWKLSIIGDGENKQKLLSLIDSLHANQKINILPKVKRIEEYYNKASIFVLNSKSEGFPNSLLEAMHFGLPCISSDCNFGPSDLITDGINGFLIPNNDIQILKERLSQLINNKDMRQTFSKNSIITTEKYKSKKVVAKWEQLINSLC